MGLFSWIIVGLLAGAIAGRVTGRRVGCVSKIAVGVIGALLGGALARAAGYEGVTKLGLRSVLLAALGASVFLLILNALGRDRHAKRR